MKSKEFNWISSKNRKKLVPVPVLPQPVIAPRLSVSQLPIQQRVLPQQTSLSAPAKPQSTPSYGEARAATAKYRTGEYAREAMKRYESSHIPITPPRLVSSVPTPNPTPAQIKSKGRLK